MEKLEIETMPLDDLWGLHERIAKLLSERILAEKRQLEARLLRLKRRPTASSTEPEPVIAKGERPRRKYPKVFPKYQNTNAPFETWSGRGKQPRWLVAALKAGNKIEDFEISNAGRDRTKAKATGHNRHD